MVPPIEQVTKHGHDLQFGTNVLGHFYLTLLLLPILISTAKTYSEDGHARVVNTSSVAHRFTKAGKKGGPIDYATLHDGPSRLALGTQSLYMQSKSVSPFLMKILRNMV